MTASQPGDSADRNLRDSRGHDQHSSNADRYARDVNESDGREEGPSEEGGSEQVSADDSQEDCVEAERAHPTPESPPPLGAGPTELPVASPQASQADADYVGAPISQGRELAANPIMYPPAVATMEAVHRPLRVTPLKSINYLRSYYYIFDSDQWFASVLVGALCVLVSQFLPIVPYIVFGGYLLYVIESLVEEPDAPYPEFSFDRFTDYMGKAVWSFLVSLPFLLVFFVIYIGSYFGGMIGLIMLMQLQDAETVGLSLSIGLPLYFFAIIVFVAFCWILAMSMMLRAGLTGSFTEAFRFRWVFDFIRRNWVEHILVFTFASITSMTLSVLGLALFCVGTFATSAMSLMALAHLMSQLYRLHVSRGGQPIQKAATPTYSSQAPQMQTSQTQASQTQASGITDTRLKT